MKMKTKYFKIIILAIGMVSLGACTDYLTVKPQGQVDLSDFWKSESDVDAVLATCYGELTSNTNNNPYIPGNISKFIVWGELRSDNLTSSNTSKVDEQRIIDGNILPTNAYASWSSLYTLINYCNTVLHYAPTVIDPNFTDSELKAKMAEALTLRALAYFYLVRVFKDVPLVTEASLSDQQDYNVAQSSENVVLDQLESDLLKAEGWAMTTYGKKVYNKGRITKAAVRALLADIYLWRNKYTECVAYCDKIISDKQFKMVKADEFPYYTIFGVKNSTESIFELQYSMDSQRTNTAISDLYGTIDKSGLFSVPKFIVTDNSTFINTPEITDERLKDFIMYRNSSSFYRIFKYCGMDRTESTDGKLTTYYFRDPQTNSPNWIFYRLTDIMLMKAEALVQLNNDDNKKDVMTIVNKVYLRSNPTVTDSLSLDKYPLKTDLEELVLVERQRELMFEGKRWFDLIRMARRDGKTARLIKLVIRKSEDNASVIANKLKDMNSLYMPVSESEMLLNDKLIQNPFYLTDILK